LKKRSEPPIRETALTRPTRIKANGADSKANAAAALY
jgi:hypothetical protein